MTSNLKFTIDLAKRAGNLALSKMGKIQKITSKTDRRDVATDVDIKVEELIVEEIRKNFPHHNIIREEGQDIDNHSKDAWIIDPIDGTKYFAAGVKHFAVSIALWQKERPILGVVYQPGTDECWWAEKGGGAFLNNKKIKVSHLRTMADTIISVGGGGIANKSKKEQTEYLKVLNKIVPVCNRFRALGAGSLCLCYLAQGYLEAHISSPIRPAKIWDVAAGMIIAEEAGAKITNSKGKWPGRNTNDLIVTNGHIHQQLLKLLNKK
ncbi:MAG TPA: inositol monophosphatase [bacterium]|nr:inositol monophosphatase [bacterium]